MFQLNEDEFTEHGAIMAAMVLNSPRATALSVYVVRAFVELRGMLSSTSGTAQTLAWVLASWRQEGLDRWLEGHWQRDEQEDLMDPMSTSCTRDHGNWSKGTSNSSPASRSQNPCFDTWVTSAEMVAPGILDLLKVGVYNRLRLPNLACGKTCMVRQGCRSVSGLARQAIAWDCGYCAQRQGHVPSRFERHKKRRRGIWAARFAEFRAKFLHTATEPAPAFAIEAQALLRTQSPALGFVPHTTHRPRRLLVRLGPRTSGDTPRSGFQLCLDLIPWVSGLGVTFEII